MSFNTVLFPCKISRGAFSGERVFEFNLQTGEQYMSVADWHYCLDDNREKLSKELPVGNQTIQGYITAYLLKSDKGVAYISIPDGEVVPVRPENIEKKAASI